MRTLGGDSQPTDVYRMISYHPHQSSSTSSQRREKREKIIYKYGDGGLIPQLSGRLYLDCGRTRRRLRRVGLALNRSVCWPQRFGPPFSIWLLSSFISLCKFFFGRVYSLFISGTLTGAGTLQYSAPGREATSHLSQF